MNWLKRHAMAILITIGLISAVVSVVIAAMIVMGI